MRPVFDLDKIAEAEAFGALAVSSTNKHFVPGEIQTGLTPAQRKAVSDMARSLIEIARKACAKKNPVTLGDFAFELRKDGAGESLSIHPAER